MGWRWVQRRIDPLTAMVFRSLARLPSRSARVYAAGGQLPLTQVAPSVIGGRRGILRLNGSDEARTSRRQSTDLPALSVGTATVLEES